MKTALAHFHQFVDFPTRGKNTLDLAYSNIEKAFRTVSRPHTGSSHHLSVKLITSYKPLLVRERPSVKQVKVWSGGTVQTGTCSEQQQLEHHCVWIWYVCGRIYTEVHGGCQCHQEHHYPGQPQTLDAWRSVCAFKSSDEEALRSAIANVNHAVRKAKRAHGLKIQFEFFHDPNNTRNMWHSSRGSQTTREPKPPTRMILTS